MIVSLDYAALPAPARNCDIYANVSEIDVRRLGPMSPTELAKARTKPAGCSDVRWRIELRRRRSVSYFSAYGEKP